MARHLLKEKINGFILLIHRAIEVNPLALYLNVGLIYAPGITHRQCVLVPALFKVGILLLHPSQDGRMNEGNAALGHPSSQVTGAEFERQVPPDA